jgi:hypothetical protein
MKLRRLIATSAVVVAAAGVLAAPANAYNGDWLINGQFERTTAPSFTPGFNPNDVDTVLAQFDNRRKVMSVRLDFFEPPTGDTFTVLLGTESDGVCVDSMSVSISRSILLVTQTREINSRVWVPDSVDLVHTAVGSTPAGVGWRYDGIDANGYRWIRLVPGHYADAPAQTTDTYVDPNRHIRNAVLNVDGIDGDLPQSLTVNNTDLTWSFTFTNTLLNRLQADCATIYIPGRRTPFTTITNVQTSPAAAPAAAPIVSFAQDAVKPAKIKKAKRPKAQKPLRKRKRTS